ncbi:MAG: DUF938 domain-containing protein [Myxococcales bacterium]|nr:DUF938 domain-containing protein [Myxococcales bacterium]
MKRHAPATERNRAFILDVLRPRLAGRRRVLEIASGTGQHSVYFAREMPWLEWQPTDGDAASLESIEAWRAEGPENVLPARRLDVTSDWGDVEADAVVCINMIHIAPWEATPALFAGASRLLAPGAPLVLYGPYRFGGVTAPSNVEFDASLRARDPRWGVRDETDITRVAEERGFARRDVVAMPANNHCLVYERSGSGPT